MLFRNRKQLAVALAVVIALTGIIGYRVYANVAANKARADRMAAGQEITVEVARVGRRDVYPVSVFSANLEPVWSADVSAKVDGRINALNVAEGDAVQAGAIIASLDSGELAAQVVQAEGNLMAARSNLEQAELDYNRYYSLADKGAISAQFLDTARTKRDAAAGQVRAAEGSLMLLKEKLNNAAVSAPRDGVVTKRYLQAGTFAHAGTAIITLANTTTLLAKATVGESQVGDLTPGATVKVRVDALDQEFDGIVARIAPAATLPARTFAAEISIPNENGTLKAGMFAKVSIGTRVHADVIAVPENALVLKEDQKTVFVVAEDNKVQQRTLKLGYVGGGWAEVLEGVTDGETIIVAGQNKVRDGVTVSPVGDGGQ
ncbi:MAG TPA: efflux RND transporter periplasmic adaptor subunit [Methylomusa anaerophila]|uniref:Macrolide export protein MacA n=1 Tax=Methylomusa anaerophila TaxID=1930071 RepID=A0A348AHC9_9FIRM|nr:efflux RND transporter periplasmic adaptor subunit [Methylomusa anaerophila]BBB90477.1 macrolide export protein MacA [Methylomusa anaerophila]HML89880.1 efflux RND transporter periplasmic adaptor subunit [Methylomusa anaerophila]